MKLKPKRDNFVLLRLYIAGESANSLKAASNLSAIAEEFLAGKHKIEIINALDAKAQPFKDAVVVTPTLVIKKASLPARQIIGDLSDKQKVLLSLDGLTSKAIRGKPRKKISGRKKK